MPGEPYSGSQRAYDVAVERVPIAARDGVELASTIYRPASGGVAVEGAFPSILERTPYDRSTGDYHMRGEYFASRGYTFVVQDCRGRFESDGEFHFYHGEHHEGLDGHDTVEWLAAQPWSDQRVATTGLSFGGANQQALAITSPPHLVTQVLGDAGYNYWRHTMRQSGAFTLGVFLPYAFFMALGSREARAPAVRAELREALAHIDRWIGHGNLKPGASPLALVPQYEEWYFAVSTGADYAGFWTNPTSSLEEHVDLYPDIPLCLVTSWYGHHTWGTFEKYDVLGRKNRQPAFLVSGVWVHDRGYTERSWAGEVEFGPTAALRMEELELRWFDQWLKGLDTGLAEEPPVRIFVMGGGDGSTNLYKRVNHGGHWRAHESWPVPGTAREAWYLRQDGGLEPQPPAESGSSTTYVFDPADPVPTLGGQVQPLQGPSPARIMDGGAFDQRGRADLLLCRDTLPLSARPDVLVFRTEPLASAVEVTGYVDVELWVGSSAPDTDFTAKLIDEYPPSDDYPLGFAMNLADSIVRLAYRNERTTADPVAPGSIERIRLGPMVTSNVFGAGHRIRVDISSSNFPQFDVNPNTGAPPGSSLGCVTARNTVYHDAEHPSHVVLPVVPPGA